MNDLAAVEQKAVVAKENAIEPITEKKLVEWLDAAGMTAKLQKNEKSMFINIAREFHLNPFKREIHVTAYGEGDNRKVSIITGYEVYIKRAERTGKLDGWEVKTEGSDKTLKAVVTIYRNDWKHPFVHEVYYSECVQYNRNNYPTAIWAKQPKFMTKKVAIGQAFRLCFSDDLGGMPYEETELPQEERDVTPEHQKPSIEKPTEKLKLADPLNGWDDGKGNVYECTQESLLEDIKEIAFALNPDAYPYFTDSEKAMEKAVAEGAENLQALKNQRDCLKKELEKRRAAFKPIPFEDKTPHTGDGFVDDLPDGMETGKPADDGDLDIF